MEETNWLDMIAGKNQLGKVMEMNQKTERFGLSLTEQDAEMLLEMRRDNLREQQRVEFGAGILPNMIEVFCDSPYLDQNCYVETIMKLQEIFYLYKNESMDELSDDELLEYMKKSFDEECEGSLEYLEETALEDFARNIRREGRSFFGNHYRNRGRRRGDE